MKKIFLFALLALFTLALAACGGGASAPAGGGDTSATGPTTLTIKGQDIAFDVNALRANAGNEIIVNFENVGTLEHNWVLLPLGMDPLTAVESDVLPGADAGILQGGESVSFSFSAPPAGVYDYVCTVEGHAVAGMVGKLTVE